MSGRLLEGTHRCVSGRIWAQQVIKTGGSGLACRGAGAWAGALGSFDVEVWATGAGSLVGARGGAEGRKEENQGLVPSQVLGGH